MKAENLLIRCSSISDIMSGTAKKWSVEDSETCKKELVRLWRQQLYGRTPMHTNKYTEHGINGEESGLTLYSVVSKKILHKNEERLNNEWVTGEVDTFMGKNILEAETIVDIKCSYSLESFPAFPPKDYIDQMQGYMWLTGAKKAIIAYCLVNHTSDEIHRHKNYLRYKYNFIDIEPKEYVEECLELERNMIFDMPLFVKENPNYPLHHRIYEQQEDDTPLWEFDIPKEDRVFEVVVERDDVRIEQIKNRIEACREYIKANPNIFKGQD